MARRRKQSVLLSLYTLPWWISGLLAAVVLYMPDMMSFMFPAGQSQAGAPVYPAFTTVAESFSPWLAAGLLIMAINVFVKELLGKEKTSA